MAYWVLGWCTEAAWWQSSPLRRTATIPKLQSTPTPQLLLTTRRLTPLRATTPRRPSTTLLRATTPLKLPSITPQHANSTPILHFSLPHVIGVDLLRRHEFTSYLKRKLKHYNNTVWLRINFTFFVYFRTLLLQFPMHRLFLFLTFCYICRLSFKISVLSLNKRFLKNKTN